MNDFFTRAVTAIMLTAGMVNAYLFFPPKIFVTLLGGIGLYALCVEWPQFKLWWLTPWYPILPFLAVMHLYLVNPVLWAWVLVIVVTFDTGSYIGGRLFGRTYVAPRISPGKTLEGFWIGKWTALIVAVGIFVVSMAVFSSILKVYFMTSFVCAIAFLGDLFESYLKRLAGIKDSGTVLPGHGGVLDRLDSFLCAAVGVDILLLFFNL